MIMSDEELAAIRAAAENAEPEWGDAAKIQMIIQGVCHTAAFSAVLTHVITSQPSAVLQMLAEIERQRRHIMGYRELTQDEINLMNEIKATAEKVGCLVELVGQNVPRDHIEAPEAFRWASIGKTDLQRGFMALIRSVARPTTF